MIGFFKLPIRTVSNAISSNTRLAAPNGEIDLTPLVLLVGYLALAVSGCSVTSWKSTFGRHHPLSGRIWDVSSARFIDRQSLITRLARADFLLLGERHENPHHPLLQAKVVAA